MDWQRYGIFWMPNGQAAITGEALKLFSAIDRLFLSWAKEWNSAEMLVPAILPAAEMEKVDYFRSFPHLATFPVTLQKAHAEDFADRFPSEPHLTETDPVENVLAPAACYYFYIQHQGEALEHPLYLTTRALCFRREEEYEPLVRQWSFSMREVVCIGTAEEVKTFLSTFQEKLRAFFTRIRMTIDWKEATDPFFNPATNGKYLAQKLDPVKTEMVFGGNLPIGSINFHKNFFGDVFRISRNGKEAFSGCVAFGIERWIYALLAEFHTPETAARMLDA